MIIHNFDGLPAAHDKIAVWCDGRSGLHGVAFGGYETRQDSVLSLLEAAERQPHARPVRAPADPHQRPTGQHRPGRPPLVRVLHGAGVRRRGGPRLRVLPVAGGGHRRLRRDVPRRGRSRRAPGRARRRRLDRQHAEQSRARRPAPAGPAASGSAGRPRSRVGPGSVPYAAELGGRECTLAAGPGEALGGAHRRRGRGIQRTAQGAPPQRPAGADPGPALARVVLGRARAVGEPHTGGARSVRPRSSGAMGEGTSDEAARIGRAGQELAQRLLTRRCAVEQWARTLSEAARRPVEAWAPPALLELLTPVLSHFGAPTGALAR